MFFCFVLIYFSLLFFKVPKYTGGELLTLYLNVERSLAFLLGLHCCYLAHGMHPTHDETDNKTWLHSKLFSSGINRDTVLKYLYVILFLYIFIVFGV